MGTRCRAEDRPPGAGDVASIPRRSTFRRPLGASPPSDLEEVGKSIGRSKRFSLVFLIKDSDVFACLSSIGAPDQIRQRTRARGRGPVTVGIDLGYIKTLLSHAAAVHAGVVVYQEPIDLARIALRTSRSYRQRQRTYRRPTQNELDRIIAAFEANKRQQIPQTYRSLCCGNSDAAARDFSD